MPIFEDKIPYAQMAKLAGTHKCGDCGGVLTVCWSPSHNCYALRCGNNIEHDSINEVDLTEYYQELNSKFGRRNKKVAQEIGTTKEIALRKYEYLPRLNREEAKEVVVTLWPKAPAPAVMKAVMICAQYGLNPLMKHVYLIPFGDSYEVVLGIKATRIIASKAGKYSYVDGTPRLMTEAEQLKIYGEVDPMNVWAITILKDSHGNIFPGYGSWPKAKNPQGMDKGNTKANMAMVRSERQALDKIQPGAIPTDVGVEDEQYMDKPQSTKVTVEPTAAPERTVDPQTGEIVEGEAQEVAEVTEASPEAAFDAMPGTGGKPVEQVSAKPGPTPPVTERAPEQQVQKTNVKSTGPVVAKNKRDPKTILNQTQLKKACFDDFGLQPDEVLEELNLVSWSMMVEAPMAAYIRIAAVRI